MELGIGEFGNAPDITFYGEEEGDGLSPRTVARLFRRTVPTCVLFRLPHDLAMNAKIRYHQHTVKGSGWQLPLAMGRPVRVNGPSLDKRCAHVPGPGPGAPVSVVNIGCLYP